MEMTKGLVAKYKQPTRTTHTHFADLIEYLLCSLVYEHVQAPKITWVYAIEV